MRPARNSVIDLIETEPDVWAKKVEDKLSGKDEGVNPLYRSVIIYFGPYFLLLLLTTFKLI